MTMCTYLRDKCAPREGSESSLASPIQISYSGYFSHRKGSGTALVSRKCS